jgi:hypothetical protein
MPARAQIGSIQIRIYHDAQGIPHLHAVIPAGFDSDPSNDPSSWSAKADHPRLS